MSDAIKKIKRVLNIPFIYDRAKNIDKEKLVYEIDDVDEIIDIIKDIIFTEEYNKE